MNFDQAKQLLYYLTQESLAPFGSGFALFD